MPFLSIFESIEELWKSNGLKKDLFNFNEIISHPNIETNFSIFGRPKIKSKFTLTMKKGLKLNIEKLAEFVVHFVEE